MKLGRAPATKIIFIVYSVKALMRGSVEALIVTNVGNVYSVKA